MSLLSQTDSAISPEKRKQATILGVMLCISYCVSYIGRLDFSACIPAMAAEGVFNSAFAGLTGTGFLIFYGIGQFINGFLGDRTDPGAMIGIGLFFSGICNICVGLSSSFPSSKYFILGFWCLAGYFSSMLWAPIVKCIAEYLTGSVKSKVAINISATIPAGTVLSYLLSSLLLSAYGWNSVFYACGSLLIAFSIVWFLIFYRSASVLKPERISHDNSKTRNGDNISGASDQTPGLFTLIASTGLVFTILSILFNGVLKDGVTLWVPSLISDSFSLSPSSASLISVILPIINLPGAYIAIKLNNRYFNNEMTTSALLFGISAASFALLCLVGSFGPVLTVILIAISTSAMLGANTMFLTYIPLEFSSVGRSSSITGFLDACSYAASAVSGVTIGKISSAYGWNAAVYSWIAVAAAGFAVTLAGARFWKAGRHKYVSDKDDNQ
ncbi:hypothetical protein SDC9_121599 [bioreactor metagenome]|uniref:Major facilitator superfamily (MFS) profile domain-containing protein n=1 Tax=bioreactor metagenome TaxID=1076179 RepID=A0A645CCG5_9ZZZZ|nr:MFS transporter [Oscillospiraceae bacterium]